MLGITIGGKKLRDLGIRHQMMFCQFTSIEDAPNIGEEIVVNFESGLPTHIDNKPIVGIEIMKYLNDLGCQTRYWKGIHLGNTILG